MRDYEEKKSILYSLQECKCLSCEKVFSVNELTIDHILPKKRASKTRKRNPAWIDEIFNLRLLCLGCHLMKRPAGFSDWDIEKIDREISLDYTGELGEWIQDEKTRELYKRAVIIYKTRKIFQKNNENS